MDALAEKWSRSGRKSSDLYKGKTDEITKELKKWILKRQDWNAAVIKLLWGLHFNNDVIFGMPDQPKPLADMRMGYKAKQLKNVERVKEYKEKRDAQTLRAEFLLASLSHRGLEWEELPSTLGWSETDAEVCSFLKTRDRTFDAQRQLKILENDKKITEWQEDYEKRQMNKDEDMLATNNADDDDAIAIPGDELGNQQPWGRYPIAIPVDVSGLLPPNRPHSYDAPDHPPSYDTPDHPPSYDTPDRPPSDDSSDCTISADTVDRVENRVEALSDTHESAEAIAQRIENMSITKNPVQKGKLSKAKIRDMRRKKAKDRAKEAGEAEEAPGDDVEEGGRGSKYLDPLFQVPKVML